MKRAVLIVLIILILLSIGGYYAASVGFFGRRVSNIFRFDATIRNTYQSIDEALKSSSYSKYPTFPISIPKAGEYSGEYTNPRTGAPLYLDVSYGGGYKCCEQPTFYPYVDKSERIFWVEFYQASLTEVVDKWYGPFSLRNESADNQNEKLSQWKTFSSNEMKISFRYPQTWFLISNNKDIVTVYTTDPNLGGNITSLDINVKTYSQVLTNTSYIQKLEAEYLNFCTPDTSLSKQNLKTIKIAGGDAYTCDSDAAPENLWTHYYFFYKDNRVYKIEATEDVGYPERREKELFDQVISTIEYIK